MNINTSAIHPYISMLANCAALYQSAQNIFLTSSNLRADIAKKILTVRLSYGFARTSQKNEHGLYPPQSQKYHFSIYVHTSLSY